jgi:hypothetical protein
MPEHRWSGWPGAWCLDCGCDDPRELALADGNWDVLGDGDGIVFPPEVEAQIAAGMDCPEPGSNRHNPYQPGGRNA